MDYPASASDAVSQIAAASDLEALEALRIAYLGKQGTVTALLKSLGGMTPEQRQSQGPAIHRLREDVTAALSRRKAELEAAALEARLASEKVDLSLPAAHAPAGSVHPVSQVMDELVEIFADLGFSVATGPEIEDDWHNFTALNMPASHPARAMHDTFYFPDRSPEDREILLRTHTSPVQIRTMMAQGAPLRIIAPGRVYRSDSDATHTPMFHQVEGLVIDKAIHLGHLKWTLETLFKAYFEREDIVLRLRPSYFPFTEPSVEFDVGYEKTATRRVVGGDGDAPDHAWMELGGSGMVNRRVLEFAGVDPDQWQGFAFGLGIDRLAMLKYGMHDLRAFFDGDVRWLAHYGFAALDVPTLSAGVGDARMKFSLSWLKYFLETEVTVEQIAAKLNAIGLEVEGIDDPSERLAGFQVVRVLTAAPHPGADKLQVLTVDTGNGTPLQVVCGAPNARAGLVGVLGLPGAVVPASGMALKVAAVRGVESNGMMCSSRELGLGDEHEGIIELPSDAPVGRDFAAYRGFDPVLDVSITPNRPDCMGVFGIARDLAAAGVGALKSHSVDPIAGAFPCPVEVRTDDPEGCPAFYARVIRGVANGASPEWMQARLTAAGMRPISALVDITNYVMLAFGRPAHAYDLAQLRGAVVARRARDGEGVTALNGKHYLLDHEITVIADDAGVHDIAGIMGGEHSGCSHTTTDVLLEVAWFNPERIAATGRKLNLTSDARSRFERGVDPQFLDAGMDILTDLVLRICGGEPSQVVRAGTPPAGSKIVHYTPSLAASLGGIQASDDSQRATLSDLGFTIVATQAVSGTQEWSVTVPSWRPDIDGAADLVEEVVRIHGLDRVASAPLPRAEGVARPIATATQRRERRLRRAAAARGAHEAVTWSFIPEADAVRFAAGNDGLWILANPISEDMKAMRPSLLPGLLAAARRNLDRGVSGLRLFEIGQRYLRGGGGLSDERSSLAMILAGEKTPRGWNTGRAAVYDAIDAKAEALALLAEAGARADNLQVMGEAGEQFHPGQSATLRLGPKTVLARFGMLHPATLKAMDIDVPVAAVELFLDALPARRDAGFARADFVPPALQPVTRDFAFLVAAALPAGDLVRAIRGADKANIVAARVFDDFRGRGVPEGQKSLAVEVTLQPRDKTYSEGDLSAIAESIVAAAAKLGAQLRS